MPGKMPHFFLSIEPSSTIDAGDGGAQEKACSIENIAPMTTGGRATRDMIGDRGEAIFFSLLTKRVTGRNVPAKGYLFQPQFLGEKWPLVDYIVELRGIAPAVKPFFFVQVKATTLGYTERENRLKVQMNVERVRGLAAYPAPTYLVGIDENMEKGYLVSVNGEQQTSLSSLSTAFPLNVSSNRRRLWEEVRAFWEIPTQPKLDSAFVDPDWR
jgi:hypothetical protein